MQDPKKSPNICHLGTIAQMCRAISSQRKHISTSEKNMLSSSMSSTCPHNTVHFCPLAAEIDPVVSGTPPNFNGFRVLAALLHGILVMGVSQTLRCSTEGATYLRQGDHHFGHLPTLYTSFFFYLFFWCILISSSSSSSFRQGSSLLWTHTLRPL